MIAFLIIVGLLIAAAAAVAWLMERNEKLQDQADGLQMALGIRTTQVTELIAINTELRQMVESLSAEVISRGDTIQRIKAATAAEQYRCVGGPIDRRDLLWWN